MAPRFSICIPNYNYADYLGETIDSVLSQDFEDFEIILQDNASTDSSWEVINDYKNRDRRIKAFRNNINIGFAPNLQRASANASGDYLILLSSDDIMLPGALRVYSEIIDSNQGGSGLVIGSNAAIINGESERTGGMFMDFEKWRLQKEYGQKIPEASKRTNEISGHLFLNDFINEESAFKAIGIFCSTCYSRDLWSSVEGYDTSSFFSPDTNFLVKLLMQNPRYVWVDDYLFGYRVHDANNYGTLRKDYNLKNVLDKYIRTLHYDQKEYEIFGVTKNELLKVFIDVICLKQSFESWIRGKYFKSVQLMCFALAAYPKLTFKKPAFYGLFLLNTIGVVFIPLISIAVRFAKGIRNGRK